MENKNGLNITMDNKEMIRIGAIAVLILDIIFMLSAYIHINAVSQLTSILGGFSETNLNLGNGTYNLFGAISLVRKIIVLNNDGNYIFGSYIFAICFWLVHIFTIVATADGAVNLIRKKGSLYSRGMGGVIVGMVMAALTVIISIIVNMNLESKTNGIISGLISFRVAPFFVCVLGGVYIFCFLPRIEESIDKDAPLYKKCNHCGEMLEVTVDVCPHCGAWKCQFCDSFNEKEEKHCISCGRERNVINRAVPKTTVQNTKLGGWICPKCDARNNENSRYCIACGAPKEENSADSWVCTKCNAQNREDSKFCTTCGAQKEQVRVSKSNSWFCRKCDARNDNGTKYCSNCGAPKEEPQTETKEIRFKHTCSQCGRTFEVKFNMQKGQTTIPKLSATCPECNSKENVTF